MSIRLIVEVLDHWKDFGLTAGERSDLIIVAENANDQTRETYGPMHEAFILQRAGKSAAGWKNSLGKLMGKKALEYAVRNGREMRGHPGQHAVYRIPELCPDPPHSGHKGMCTRPERVTSEVTQSHPGREEMGHPTDDPSSEMGHLSGANGSPDGCEWVTSPVTPTPLSPQSPPLSLPHRLVRDSGVVTDEERETFIEWIKNTLGPNGPGWWRTVASNGDFAALAEKWRGEHRPAPASLPRWCGHCGDGNPAAQFNPNFRQSDDAPCPDCHPDVRRSNAS
ncbi:hypothetical protein [Streptomyces chartreusis]